MKKLIPVFLFAFLALPLFANAAPVAPLPIICTIFQTIKIILAAIGFGIAVIMIIWGGIQYMTAGGDPEKAGKARKMIINGLIGFAIVFAAIFILALVQGLLTGSGITLIGNPCPGLESL